MPLVAHHMLTNADLGELLWAASREETDHRRRAMERASRASRFWSEEAGEIAAAGRPLTELRSVGPWVAARIEAWLEAQPPIPEPDETRRRFLTYAEVRRVLDADPEWESSPCADLQLHTTWSDGAPSIAAGEIEDAIKQLEQLRKRVDGCGAEADQTDWITDCAEQVAVRNAIDTLVANLSS